MRKHPFTLLELLSVIVIIAVLGRNSARGDELRLAPG
jgi:prepilin-type N-terminal cleavage/methylation domain-containing protein